MHLDIAFDESGFSGGNLVGLGHSPVFAHASIRIDSDTASQLVQQLRHEIGARGAGEYKSAESLGPRRRPIVLWLLGGTVRGIACPGRDRRTRPMALALYRSGEQSYGPSRWQEFLTLSANLF